MHVSSADSDDSAHFEQLISSSRELTYDVTALLTTYFELVAVDKDISLEGTGDGFFLGVEIRPFLSGPVTLDSVKIQLVPVIEDGSEELWLQTSISLELSNGLNRLCPTCNVSIIIHVD